MESYSRRRLFLKIYNVPYLPIMVYDSEKRTEKVYKGTIGDITTYQSEGTDCDRIVIQFREANGVGLIVYK